VFFVVVDDDEDDGDGDAKDEKDDVCDDEKDDVCDEKDDVCDEKDDVCGDEKDDVCDDEKDDVCDDEKDVCDEKDERGEKHDPENDPERGENDDGNGDEKDARPDCDDLPCEFGSEWARWNNGAGGRYDPGIGDGVDRNCFNNIGTFPDGNDFVADNNGLDAGTGCCGVCVDAASADGEGNKSEYVSSTRQKSKYLLTR